MLAGWRIFPIEGEEPPSVSILWRTVDRGGQPWTIVDFNVHFADGGSVSPGRAAKANGFVRQTHCASDDGFDVHRANTGQAPNRFVGSFFTTQRDVFLSHVLAHVTA